MKNTAKILFTIILALVFTLVLILGLTVLPALKANWGREEVVAATTGEIRVGPDGSALLSEGMGVAEEIERHLAEEQAGEFSHEIQLNRNRATLDLVAELSRPELEESQLLQLWEKLAGLQPELRESGWHLNVTITEQHQGTAVKIRGTGADNWEQLRPVLDLELPPASELVLNLDGNSAEVRWQVPEAAECVEGVSARSADFQAAALQQSQRFLRELAWEGEKSPGLLLTAQGCGGRLSFLAELLDGQRPEKLAALPAVLAAAGEDIQVTRLWIVADHLPPEGAAAAAGRGKLLLRGQTTGGSAPDEENIRAVLPALQEQWGHGILRLNGQDMGAAPPEDQAPRESP